jgi:hypothetical protein
MADVSVSLDLSAQELYQELQNVQAHFAQFASKTVTHGDQASKGFVSSFKAGLGSLGTNLTQALAAVGLGAEIKQVVEYGSKIQDLSDRFGVSAVNLQKFGNVAEKNGASLEAVAKGFRFLEVNQSKALGGNEAMVQSFAALGVSAQELRSLSPEEIMLKIGSSSLNAADVVKVLGKSALELRPTLAGLADGTLKFGDAISGINISKLDQANDTFKHLKETVTIFVGTVIGSFVTNFQASIAELVSKAYAAVEEFKGLANGIKAFIDASKGGEITYERGFPEVKPGGKSPEQAFADEIKKGHEAAKDQITAGNELANEYRHPAAEPVRKFTPDEGGEAGKTDDEGRATGRLPKAEELDVIGADRDSRREEEKEAREAAREARESVRAAAKARPVSLLDAAQAADEADRRAHGAYTGPGGTPETEGLVSGHVQSSKYESQLDNFKQHMDKFGGSDEFNKFFHPDKAKDLKDSQKDAGKNADKNVDVAKEQLEELKKIGKNTEDIGGNK